MQKSKKIAVYGTLKSGHYNYDRFKAKYPSIEVIDAGVISGYEMYNFGGWYPVITKGEGNITVEVLEVPAKAYDAIVSMEEGAGYEIELIEVNGHYCTLFVYQGTMAGYTKVEDGNWTSKNYHRL